MRSIILLILSLYLHVGYSDVLNYKAKNFADVAAIYTRSSPDPEKTLLVFDIDDTLLTMSQDLGSVAWWDWQSDLLKNHPVSNQLATHQVKNLVRIQNLLFHLIKMETTDEFVLPFIKEATEKGASLMALTARGSEHASITLTQMEDNDFVDQQKQLLFNRNGVILMPQHSTTTTPLLCPQLTQPISYYQGIAFLNGEDKGLALRCILNQSSKSYTTILFVDDVKHNSDSVEKAFSNQRDVKVLNVLYTHEHAKQQLFLQSQNLQEVAHHQWVNIKHTIDDNIMKPSLENEF